MNEQHVAGTAQCVVNRMPRSAEVPCFQTVWCLPPVTGDWFPVELLRGCCRQVLEAHRWLVRWQSSEVAGGGSINGTQALPLGAACWA